ncbi:adenylate kinase family protein [Metamycoplasma buccale]|uniref:adenylate kinase family protein n=1 Tax=Metamycoplasma buccale TaxID=55602 RepID=UPI00398E56F3
MIVNNKPNLIFLGAPGAGKGSIASRIVKEHGYFQLSTGEMFRQEIQNKSKLGLEIKSILDSGIYVNDSLTNELVKERVTELTNKHIPFILDGYPRTLSQANFLQNLSKDKIKIDKVILLNITDDQVIERLSKRRICPNCKTIYHLEFNPPKKIDICDNCGTQIITRLDDAPEVVKQRLQVYANQTKCLIEFYRNLGILIEINAYQDYDKVYSDVKEALNWL